MSDGKQIKGWYSKDYHYSRHNSTKFWKRVNGIKDETMRNYLYFLGCELQNLEERVLERLRNAEK